MELIHVINQAKKRSGAKNDAVFARMLGVNPQNLRPWFRGYGLPKDDVMIRLCQLAAMDPAEGLLLLNTWRSEGEVRETYASLLAQLGKSAAALAFALLIFIAPMTTAEAKVNLSSASVDLHIMGNMHCALRCL